jgi:hypothetical protein
MTRKLAPPLFLAALIAAFAGASVRAQESAEDLAKQTQNPVANLISVPLQENYECCIGPDSAGRDVLNIQPVIPVPVGGNLTMIVRTILPVIGEARVSPANGPHFGVGDITQSFFFAPPPMKGGIIFAAGPAFIWPIGGAALGSEKWSAGPTFVLLKQSGPTTVGVLANQLWSYAGSGRTPNVSSLFVQPFFSYTWPNTTTFSLNTEAGYDWIHRQWTVPVNVGVSHIFKFGPQLVSLGATAKVYADSPNGPQGGLRLTATFLFPSK